jgi:hypothetical protein
VKCLRILLVAGGAAGLLIGGWTWTSGTIRETNEREAASALKTLASAEADFRGNDRDGNRIQDFWMGDVAGLYYFQNVKLIEKDVADADAKPVRPGAPPPVPRRGYFFVAMEGDDSGMEPEVYAQDTNGEPNRGPHFHHSKFGFCAYPSDYPRSGRWTYFINEGNTIFKRDLGGMPLLRWPADPDTCRKCLGRLKLGHACYGNPQ